jgi:diguanylate cyclase (GGDEF)-like protein
MTTTDAKPKILIVDDEPAIRDLLSQMLEDEYDCVPSGSAEDALLQFVNTSFDLVISDINLGGMTGVEMVPRLHEIAPDAVVMVISGANSMETAIEAMRAGVFDYVRKPFDYDQVIGAVRKGVEHHRRLVEKLQRDKELSFLIEKTTAELHHISNYDPLTNLPNEAMFHSRVNSSLAALGHDPRGALLLISLPNMRLVQNTFGQNMANRIIIEIANRLRGVANADFVSKFEGNRFGIWLPEADEAGALEATNSIIDILRPVFVAGGHEIHAHVNIGISIFPTDGDRYPQLVQSAGAVLSRAEAEGPGHYQFFAAEMNEQAFELLKLETSLQNAIERGELSLRYQPKLSARTREIVGAEALVRWESSEFGSISPAVFIPIAEGTDLILSIGEWVLQTACLQVKRWHEMGFNVHVAVNLSGRQFEKKDLATCIWDVLNETGMDPNHLNLEVTESSLVKRPEVAIEVLTQLQKLGVNVSIDDFGTGHSSLSYLRALPVDVLKIDKSFVGSITTNADAATLVKTIITLAHDLRLRVVAEGVETEEQLSVLSNLGCDEWQGFLHSKPLHANQFEELLRTGPLGSTVPKSH